MAKTMRRLGGGRRCLVCDWPIPKKTAYRSVFENLSDMDEVDRGLSERLEIIFDTKLNQDNIHSSEICHLCEAKVVQIEEYFRLLLVFRETFKKTNKKYSQIQSAAGKLRHGMATSSKKSRVVHKKNIHEGKLGKRRSRKDELPHNSRTNPPGQNVISHGTDFNVEENTVESKNTAEPEQLPYKDELPGDSTSDNSESTQLVDNESSSITGAIDSTESRTSLNPQTIESVVDSKALVTKRFAGKRKYKCITCSKVFANMRNLKRHQVTHSADHKQTTYQCPACDQTFTQTNSFRSHIKLHKVDGLMILTCKRCSMAFRSKDDLKRHLEKNCQRNKPHECTLCGLVFRCKSELANHEMIHAGTKPFACTICKKSFSRQQSLKEHSRVHTSERPFKCEQCSASFRFRSGLKFHRKKEHDKDRPYMCRICSQTFAILANLQGHLKTHTGEKSHLCPECGRGFAQSGTLQLHRATHSNERPYKCVSCDAAFKRADILQRHMLTHSTDRPFKCVQCDQAYRDRDSLHRHILNHSSFPLHPCLTCNKSFKRKSDLKEHMNLHNDENAHRCLQCGKQFATARYLRKHMRIHDKNPTDGIEVNEERKHEGRPTEVPIDSAIVTTENSEYAGNGRVEDGLSPTTSVETAQFPPGAQQQDHNAILQTETVHQEPIFAELKTATESGSHHHKQQTFMSETQQTHDYRFVCASSGLPSSSELIPNPQIYSQSHISSQATLPPMSEAFNETLNLKMNKFDSYDPRDINPAITLPNNYQTPINTVYHPMDMVQSQAQRQTVAMGPVHTVPDGVAMAGDVGISSANNNLYPGLSTLSAGQANLIGPRHTMDQPMPNLYPRQHEIDHTEENQYH